jgi:hypothetical protein
MEIGGEAHTNSDPTSAALLATDPRRFIALAWPGMRLSGKQQEVLLSVRDNLETFVHAANQTGKTPIAAIAAIWFFASRTPARVVISSSNEVQLVNVLWAEILRLIRSAAWPLPLVATHFFYHCCKGGDVDDPAGGEGLLRKVIRIGGRDSPNVQLGLRWQQENRAGAPLVLISGLLTYAEYLRREQQWDEVKRTTRLHGHFYEGDRALLFPAEWLDAATDPHRWGQLQRQTRRAEAMGVDVAAPAAVTRPPGRW